MKNFKTVLISFMLCVGFAVTFGSCSDDDKNEPEMPAAKSVAGTYKGDMTCSVMGDESVFGNMTFTLTATDDATVGLVISSFGEPPMQVPELTIPGIKVSGENGNYTLASTEFEQEANGKKCSGVVMGSFENNQLTIRYNLNFGAMPMPLICTFVASK